MRRSVLYSAISSVAAILILAAGCADQGPTMVQLESGSISAARSAQANKVRAVTMRHIASSYSTVIGREGGTLSFGIGTLVFPAGAVDQPTHVTATTDGLSASVVFGPHGLTYPNGAEPTLTISYANASVDGRSLGVAYVDEAGTLLETLTSTVNPNDKSVSARLSHFSRYVLAAE